MTSTNNNQEKNSPRDGQNNKIGAEAFIPRLKQKFINLIDSKSKRHKRPGCPRKTEPGGSFLWWGTSKDEHPEVKTPGAGTFIIWIKQKFVNLIGTKDKDGSPDKTPGAGTPFWQGQKKPGHPRTNGDMGTPFWWGTSKDGRPRKTTDAGTP